VGDLRETPAAATQIEHAIFRFLVFVSFFASFVLCVCVSCVCRVRVCVCVCVCVCVGLCVYVSVCVLCLWCLHRVCCACRVCGVCNFSERAKCKNSSARSEKLEIIIFYCEFFRHSCFVECSCVGSCTRTAMRKCITSLLSKKPSNVTKPNFILKF